ncbi:MAG: ribonuclease [Frankiales bacterium]|nr:ribonuclease [Frankiales bacterium]
MEAERGLRDLGWRDWRAVLWRAVVDMRDDAAALLSAGVAFYMFLSVFPALLAALTLYGLFADPGQGELQVERVLDALPTDVHDVLAERVHAAAARSGAQVSLGVLGAVLGAVWTASLGLTGLLKAVRIAYDEEEDRGFLVLRGTGLLLTLGAIAFLLAALGLLAVLPAVLDTLGLDAATRAVVQVLRWGAVVSLALVALTLVYHLGSGRPKAHPGWTGPGTVVAATVWTALNAAFSWYAAHSGTYGSTYGGLSGSVVLLLWLFLTNLVVLFGAQVNAEAERQARGQVRHRVLRGHEQRLHAWWQGRDREERVR